MDKFQYCHPQPLHYTTVSASFPLVLLLYDDDTAHTPVPPCSQQVVLKSFMLVINIRLGSVTLCWVV